MTPPPSEPRPTEGFQSDHPTVATGSQREYVTLQPIKNEVSVRHHASFLKVLSVDAQVFRSAQEQSVVDIAADTACRGV